MKLRSDFSTKWFSHSVWPFAEGQINRQLSSWMEYWHGIRTGKRAICLPGFVVSDRPLKLLDLKGGYELTPTMVISGFLARLNKELSTLIQNEQLPRSSWKIFCCAWDRILKFSKVNQVPYFGIERIMNELYRAVLGENADPYLLHKTISRALFLDNLGVLSDRIRQAKDPLKEAFLLSLRGNFLGSGDVYRVLKGTFILKDILDAPVNLALNNLDAAVDFIRSKIKPRIVIIGDNAGESITDLLLAKCLCDLGGEVTYLVKAKNSMNDETYTEVMPIALLPGLAGSIRIMPGSDIPSVDLLNMSPEMQKVISEADLVIVKGEANFLGLHPGLVYKTNFLYVLKVKVYNGLGEEWLRFDGESPQLGDSVIYFKPGISL